MSMLGAPAGESSTGSVSLGCPSGCNADLPAPRMCLKRSWSSPGTVFPLRALEGWSLTRGQSLPDPRAVPSACPDPRGAPPASPCPAPPSAVRQEWCWCLALPPRCVPPLTAHPQPPWEYGHAPAPLSSSIYLCLFVGVVALCLLLCFWAEEHVCHSVTGQRWAGIREEARSKCHKKVI